MDITDPKLDPEDVVQDIPDAMGMMPAPVTVQNPVRVQQLPRNSSGMLTFNVTSQPRRVLTADPRRARAILLPRTQDIYFGNSASESQGGYAAWWPVGKDLVLMHCDEVWVSCAVGMTTDLTVITEQWSG